MALQILVEKALIESIGLEWAGLDGNAGSCTAPAAGASQIAVRNHALLTQRMESDLAASRVSYSRVSYSLGSPGKTAVPQLPFLDATLQCSAVIPLSLL